MKRTIKFMACAVAACIALSACAVDLKGLLGGKNGGNTTQDAVSGLLGAVGGLIGGNTVDLKSLEGTWNYESPAITFESDNFLQKAGGAAASGVIVGKLAPYYKMAGVDKMSMTFSKDTSAAEGTESIAFTATVNRMKISGTMNPAGEGVYEFHFKALGKVPAGQMKAYLQRSGNNLSLTFDAKKLMSIVKTLATVSGNGTVQTVSDLLNSYDGLNIGVTLKKK